MEMSVRARIRAGDADTFGSLFDDYARAVNNHAFRLTGDWSVAEDVLSLTFLEAWRLRKSVDPDGGSLRPWLLGIATNVARNTRRAARRHEAAMNRLPREEVFPDFADELVGRIDDAERVVALRAALSRLRRPEREVVALCVWAGLDYAAAAKALDIPVGTVRSRLSRARKKLHKYAGAGLSSFGGNPDPGRGQTDGDRGPAVRPTQEEAR
ncbi:RNA polymerase sigma factor [Streptomyces solicathayae]|uniref:RNA polymerase sigma factor n=1 Tax=Streptomyces solicathayae TaxID=3081768 RepID=A0ABZ0LK87_9ACTN|nr:RNA polymerase sigma factor [Streptomyces sp. HUAS YS2]WOX19901.1 RNA polymerase sigma factor [Streptomyces sp. HUAS YS2]